MLQASAPPAALLLAWILTAGASAAEPMRGMTYDSIKELPDFAGPWIGRYAPQSEPPLRPEFAAAWHEATARIAEATRNGVDPADLGLQRSYCKPPRFAGFNKNDAHDYFEFLFTPGRVTITNELGLIRRIRLDAGPLPAKLEESNTGTSIAHWEGQTLVVETGGLKSDTRLFRGPAALKLTLGKNARVLERISLKEPDVLEIVVRITAPDLLTAPWESTLQYRRKPAHVIHEISTCVDEDRSFDDATGKERFDLTPPPDLPPPPSR